MNQKSWYIVYIILFFSIFIPSILFLFSGNDLTKNPNGMWIRVRTLDEDNTHATQDLNDCINSLMNNLQSGNTNFNALHNCLGLNLNGEGNNDTQILPEPPTGEGLQTFAF
jgi:hypothetical protein